MSKRYIESAKLIDKTKAYAKAEREENDFYATDSFAIKIMADKLKQIGV